MRSDAVTKILLSIIASTLIIIMATLLDANKTHGPWEKYAAQERHLKLSDVCPDCVAENPYAKYVK